MGLFEDILQRSQDPAYMPARNAAFPELEPEAQPGDEWTKIQEQERKDREAADRRNAAGMKRSAIVPPSFQAPDMNAPGVQLAMENAPPGTGVPFSTQAGMLPPVTLGQGDGSAVPLPPERPSEAPPRTPTDLSSRARDATPANLP